MDALLDAGYECYVVGGAARAILLGTRADDWDVATSAPPSEVRRVIEWMGMKPIDKGEAHGTVGASDGGVTVEFTTFRAEGEYSDARHPDSVTFIGDIEGDLSRRDFTVNAIAMKWPGLEVTDPFRGVEDLRRGIIRAVGDAASRFAEDALRMIRAVRFESEHGWRIEPRTRSAISRNAQRVRGISAERVRDEVSRVLVGPHAGRALADMVRLGLMDAVVPELSESGGVGAGRLSGRTLMEHAIMTADAVAPSLVLRLAALLHDVAKPRCLGVDDRGRVHFHGHDALGAEMVGEILERLRYPKVVRDRVRVLVKEHMFFYSPEATDAALRRLVGRVGEEGVFDLLELRRADVVASGGDAAPFLRQVEHRVRDILDRGQAVRGSGLAVNGEDVMEVLDIGPGPRVGQVLQRLLDMVLDDPGLNQRDKLRSIIAGMKPGGGDSRPGSS
jgi:putative nucleotidyltransferase with HDIG domain